MANSKLSKCPKCGGRLKKVNKYRPGIVLDPFAGSCTTGKVAAKLRRDYVMIDLKPEYIEMGEKRVAEGETGVSVREQNKGQLALFGMSNERNKINTK